ncbi:mucin-5AC-like [Saccoglossus kowalevskii]|uniref:Uncharacterized protein LOC100371616 n=1 Tax=Saccoglossus kowalevskii TaxID=10224 RepID=A0ABM0GPE7_SACKO|nr:PREDICTED: uncharacterized protein LOC100371616 [Saccoglossus kowalevskii]
MVKIGLFPAVLCVFIALGTCVNGKHIQSRRSNYDSNVTVLPLQDAINLIDLNETNTEMRRQTMGIFPNSVIAYVLFGTCEFVTFWIIDIANIFGDGWMKIKYYKHPEVADTVWKTVQRNTFSFLGRPTFTVTLGPYDPCSTITIISRLENNNGFARLGTFAMETDCPCDPGTGQGDPHYVTFDRQHIDFNGPCSYTLLNTVPNTTNHTLQVVAKHGEVVNRFVNADARRIETAYLYIDDHTVELRDNGVTIIDGVINNQTTYMTPDLAVSTQIISNATSVVFSQGGRWWVEWDKNTRNNRNRLFIGIHKDSELMGNTFGMLGIKTNETDSEDYEFKGFRLLNGTYTYDQEELGNSYEVNGSCP